MLHVGRVKVKPTALRPGTRHEYWAYTIQDIREIKPARLTNRGSGSCSKCSRKSSYRRADWSKCRLGKPLKSNRRKKSPSCRPDPGGALDPPSSRALRPPATWPGRHVRQPRRAQPRPGGRCCTPAITASLPTRAPPACSPRWAPRPSCRPRPTTYPRRPGREGPRRIRGGPG